MNGGVFPKKERYSPRKYFTESDFREMETPQHNNWETDRHRNPKEAEKIKMSQRGDMIYFSGLGAEKAEVAIFDLNGQTLLRAKVSDGEGIEVSNLHNGVFIIKPKNEAEKEDDQFKGILYRQFFLIIALSAVYIVLIDIIGFFVTTAIYLFVTMLALKSSIKWSIVVSILFPIFLYLIFVSFLKVPVPRGFLL